MAHTRGVVRAVEAGTKNTDLNKPRHSNVQFKRPTGGLPSWGGREGGGRESEILQIFPLSRRKRTAGKRTFCLFSSPRWINPSVDEESEGEGNDVEGGRGG